MLPWFAHYDATQQRWRIYCLTDGSLSLLRGSSIAKWQYRQMSGGRFLISEKDINISEKILKIKALSNEGVEIDSTVSPTEEDPAQVSKLMENVEEFVGKANSLQLNDDSREVSI